MGATTDEIMKVSNALELSSSNKMLKWQLALRNPYIDPVNIMQVKQSSIALCYSSTLLLYSGTSILPLPCRHRWAFLKALFFSNGHLDLFLEVKGVQLFELPAV